MSRRRELNGVTKDFAESMNSRNNDFQGYWAIGQLYSLALDNRTSSLTLDILNCSNNLDCSEVNLICENMMLSLNRIISRYKLPIKWVSSVSLKFSFEEKYQKEYHYWRSSLGLPYIIELEIITDLGYTHKSIQGGNVLPHDSKTESRRNGF